MRKIYVIGAEASLPTWSSPQHSTQSPKLGNPIRQLFPADKRHCLI
jgi:hypothetical protein